MLYMLRSPKVHHNYNLRSKKNKNVTREIKYYTRSVTSNFEKFYDFDVASKEWNLNKNKDKYCSYAYK